jgi:hypothetical protein
MTLADGSNNPTFMLQHEEGQNWRYSPSKKFLAKLKAVKDAITPSAPAPVEQKEEVPVASAENALLIDPASLVKGAEDFCKLAMNTQHLSAGKDSQYFGDLLKTLGYGTVALGQGFANTARNHPLLTGASLFGLASGVSKLRDRLQPERVIEKELDPRLKTQEVLGNISLAAIPTIGAAAAAI